MPRPKTPKRDTVRTTIDMPADVWRAAKMAAVDRRCDLRVVILTALRRDLGLPMEETNQ